MSKTTPNFLYNGFSDESLSSYEEHTTSKLSSPLIPSSSLKKTKKADTVLPSDIPTSAHSLTLNPYRSVAKKDPPKNSPLGAALNTPLPHYASDSSSGLPSRSSSNHISQDDLPLLSLVKFEGLETSRKALLSRRPHRVEEGCDSLDIYTSGSYFPSIYANRELNLSDKKDFNPTLDVFVNSLKIKPYSLLFNSVFLYIDLLHVLPCFTLPLYDPGVIQYVCEDIALHSRFTGLEVPYRLLTHDIWFLAMYAYMSDIPTWARPPINLIRIYKFQAYLSLDDIDHLHSIGLVYHNINTILSDFSDTVNTLELTYPEGFSLNMNPLIYFHDFTTFAETLGFFLAKIILSKTAKDCAYQDHTNGTSSIDQESDNEDVDGLFRIRQELDCVYDSHTDRASSSFGSKIFQYLLREPNEELFIHKMEKDEHPHFYVKSVIYKRFTRDPLNVENTDSSTNPETMSHPPIQWALQDS